MKIELHQIPIREVVAGYRDSAENGVVAYGGKLNVRPPYQREFIYKDKQRDEVIRTVMRDFPLNVMYWVKNEDGNFEVLDGQQRTISICQYVDGAFLLDQRGFFNLTAAEQDQILDYPLMIYVCEGNDREKLDWFRIINIAGEKLTDQELRNATYPGAWLHDAKRHFSKTGCAAYGLAGDLLNGSAIRQDYLEAALRWIAARDGVEIEAYMAAHQHDTNCNELWLYFQSVVNWVRAVFPNKRREMKGLEWGDLYNRYHANAYDPALLETRIVELMEDDDVTKNSGIYEYLLGGDARFLNIRAFTPKMARLAYEKQNGVCPVCGKRFPIEEMHADHITPWSRGGHTSQENCQMLCADCNRRKSNL